MPTIPLEATGTSGIAQTSLKSPHLALSAMPVWPQEVVMPWQRGAPKVCCPIPDCSLPQKWGVGWGRVGGVGQGGGGNTRKQDRAGSPGRRRALWARHKQPAQETTAHPRPPHPPKALGERSAKSLVPQREQRPGVSPGQGKSQKRSSPLSAPDPTWGGGEEARLAGMVLPL